MEESGHRAKPIIVNLNVTTNTLLESVKPQINNLSATVTVSNGKRVIYYTYVHICIRTEDFDVNVV